MKIQDIVITGSGGWFGRRFVEVLLHGAPESGIEGELLANRLRCLCVSSEQENELRQIAAAHSARVETVVGDIRSPETVARLFQQLSPGAIVVHSAGIIHPKRVREFYEINVTGTENVLRAADAARAQRVVVLSSNSPIGCNPYPDHRFTESSPYNPYMNYGRSKMLMEQFVNGFQPRNGVEKVIIRPPWFYGPYQPARQSEFFKMVANGGAPLLGTGLQQRSMVYVDNLCQGALLAATVPGISGNTYWIADERPYSMNEILSTIERVLERDFKVPCNHKRLRLPSIASEIAYICDKMIQGAGLYHQKMHVLSEMNKSIACSIDKAKDDLGYQPRVALEEGMRRSIQWLIDRSANNSSAGVAWMQASNG